MRSPTEIVSRRAGSEADEIAHLDEDLAAGGVTRDTHALEEWRQDILVAVAVTEIDGGAGMRHPGRQEIHVDALFALQIDQALVGQDGIVIPMVRNEKERVNW
jgi:hypothetical protein